MRAYELMVLIDPEVDERTVEPTLGKFLDVVRNDGGSPSDQRHPQARLARLITIIITGHAHDEHHRFGSLSLPQPTLVSWR